MKRPFNFAPGPATLPESVLERASAEMLDWHGSGMSVMEMSHRGREFGEILHRAEADLRSLLKVPAEFHILFMQGGGLAENAIVPMNLSEGRAVDVVVTGSWSTKSLKEASKYCNAVAAASGESGGSFQHIPAPSTWHLRANAAYVHICSNETIDGVEFQTLPDLHALGTQAPLVMDCSSHIASRSIDWSRVGLAFAGAQKNIGPAGLTLVVVRSDLLGRSLPVCPSAFNYETVAAHRSMFNTPPTYAIYMAGLVFQWILAEGGVTEMEMRSIRKSGMLYDYIDSTDFYVNRVDRECRSRMNVPFFLTNESLNARFLKGAEDAGLLQLKGHKSVGGMRASLYNAMPVTGVEALVSYMREFARTHG